MMKTAPTWGPAAKQAAAGAAERVGNREKAISQATQVGGQFAGVWLRDRRYWVVRKDGDVVNSFPACDDEQALERAAGRLLEEAWIRPESLLRERARAKAAKLRHTRRRGSQ